MKKMIRILCVVLILLMLPIQVSADIIYEPWDDSFYEEHRDQCEYHARSYYTAGPNGDVTVYESPESAWEEMKLSNGTVLWISYIYEDPDGITWGYWAHWEMDWQGWVPMDYLVLIYDGISFEEEYGAQFRDEPGQLDSQYRGRTIYFWDYPGCRTYSGHTLSETEEYLPEYSLCYTDPDGRTWGKIGYYMGHRNCWICLDDPTADFDVLYPEGIEETEPVTQPLPETEVEEIKPGGNPSIKWIVIASVAGVVALTAVLLFFLKKKA